MSSREQILARARDALGPAVSVPDVPRDYRGAGGSGLNRDELVELFSERVLDYGAELRHAEPGGPQDAVTAVAVDVGVRRLGAPPVLAMSVPEVEFVLDEPPLSAEALERLDGVLTGCALAIAETGTIILDGGPRSGRRIISLIPDLHICLVERTKIVATVPDALATLASDGRQVSPLTFVSGPSATVDIGFERVEGVHGPRRLIVVLVP